MSMLAERRRKTKWIINPTKKPLWTTHSNGVKFGKELMEKMGWSAGKGLGANEQGIQEPLKVTYKNDTKGMGFKGNDDDWIEHQDEFNMLLNQLRNNDVSVVTASEADKNKIKSLEEKSKQSKARVHYQKFTRGKDLSQYSQNDLECILGINKSRKEKPRPEEVVQTEEKTEGHFETSFGVTTINSGFIEDYFKKKKFSYVTPLSNGVEKRVKDFSESFEELGVSTKQIDLKSEHKKKDHELITKQDFSEVEELNELGNHEISKKRKKKKHNENLSSESEPKRKRKKINENENITEVDCIKEIEEYLIDGSCTRPEECNHENFNLLKKIKKDKYQNEGESAGDKGRANFKVEELGKDEKTKKKGKGENCNESEHYTTQDVINSNGHSEESYLSVDNMKKRINANEDEIIFEEEPKKKKKSKRGNLNERTDKAEGSHCMQNSSDCDKNGEMLKSCSDIGFVIEKKKKKQGLNEKISDQVIDSVNCIEENNSIEAKSVKTKKKRRREKDQPEVENCNYIKDLHQKEKINKNDLDELVKKKKKKKEKKKLSAENQTTIEEQTKVHASDLKINDEISVKKKNKKDKKEKRVKNEEFSTFYDKKEDLYSTEDLKLHGEMLEIKAVSKKKKKKTKDKKGKSLENEESIYQDREPVLCSEEIKINGTRENSAERESVKKKEKREKHTAKEDVESKDKTIGKAKGADTVKSAVDNKNEDRMVNGHSQKENGVHKHKVELLNEKMLDKFYPGQATNDRVLRLFRWVNLGKFKGSNLESLTGYGQFNVSITNRYR